MQLRIPPKQKKNIYSRQTPTLKWTSSEINLAHKKMAQWVHGAAKSIRV